jgi:hypothetical protein
MDIRTRKRRRVVDLSSEDDLDDPVDSESEDVMCGQFYDDDAFVDKSSSDVEMFSEVSFFIMIFFSFFIYGFFHDLALIFLCIFIFLGFIIWWFSCQEIQ